MMYTLNRESTNPYDCVYRIIREEKFIVWLTQDHNKFLSYITCNKDYSYN